MRGKSFGDMDFGARWSESSSRWWLNLKVPMNLFDAMLVALEAARAGRYEAKTHEAG